MQLQYATGNSVSSRKSPVESESNADKRRSATCTGSIMPWDGVDRHSCVIRYAFDLRQTRRRAAVLLDWSSTQAIPFESRRAESEHRCSVVRRAGRNVPMGRAMALLAYPQLRCPCGFRPFVLPKSGRHRNCSSMLAHAHSLSGSVLAIPISLISSWCSTHEEGF